MASYQNFLSRSARPDRQHRERQGRSSARAWSRSRTIPTWSSRPTKAPPRSPTSPTRLGRVRLLAGRRVRLGWLAGYDHKKMGSPRAARGRAVKRHFREIGVIPSRTDFTVVGIGDMSGDVFGNGMLFSRAHPPPGRVRPSPHLPRSRPRTARPALQSGSGCSICRARLGRLRQDADLRGRRRLLPRRQDRSRYRAEVRKRAGRRRRGAHAGGADESASSRRRSTCCGTAASAPT